ncbi:hypothetical protein [Gordonia sp. (in: high G+C Gram-positive bacteria)]|uniref:hypothetical protein n=1 Tax=Gordonia sp. (in: high G+C Gram-positive bacteria) TaxID=84139 RepID=UPI0035294C02
MTAPTANDVAAFLGEPTNAETAALAEQHLPIVTAMARSYTRGRGFDDDGPAEDLAAVIITATARLMENPKQFPYDQTAGQMSVSFRGAFVGWNLAETFVLNRYRRRAR